MLSQPELSIQLIVHEEKRGEDDDVVNSIAAAAAAAAYGGSHCQDSPGAGICGECANAEERIRRFLNEELIFSDALHYDDATSFLGAGIIDSLGVIELVTWVQSEFGIAVDVHDITRENFDSIRTLATYVRSKCSSHIGRQTE